MNLSLQRKDRRRVAAGLVAAAWAAGLGCSSGQRGYGTLACLDAWPDAPAAAPPSASLVATPALVWRAPLAHAGLVHDRGVALSGTHVIATAGEMLIGLEGTTGAQLFTVAVSASALMSLGRPSVDDAGAIHVQSPTGGVVTLAPDGTMQLVSGPAGYVAADGDPVSGWGEDLTLLNAAEVLAYSSVDQQALDAQGATLWSSTYPAYQALGHWGVGYDERATYLVDLRTGAPAGRLRAGNGHDVVPLVPLAGRGILTVDRSNTTGLRAVLLDACGKQVWSADLRVGCGALGSAVVGPGELTYVSTQACQDTTDTTLVALGPDGSVSRAPVSPGEGPWLVGADGTIYTVKAAADGGEQTRLTARSPSLVELWHLDLPGLLHDANAALTDDGLLYARLETVAGEAVAAIQTTSPGLARSSWPTNRHDNRASNWGGGPF